ncbi:hypothetical protein TeGR_g2061, partial [Tetraparma gracilis]
MTIPVTLLLLLLLLAAHTARAEYAIVTGASSGIGRALALAAAQEGYDVVLCARRESALLALSDVIRTTHQRATVIVPTDLSTSAGIDTLLHTTASLDVSTIFVNAGFAWSDGSLSDQPTASIEEMVNLNIMSSSKLASLYGSVFKERGSGKIMITSSLTALASLPGASLYAATRGFVRQLGAGLRAELAPHGVVVTTLLPGATDTEFAVRTNIQSALIFTFPGSRLLGLTLSSEVVADYALEGLKSGAAEVIPGFMNRAYAMAAENLMPAWMSRRYATYTFCEPNPLFDPYQAPTVLVVMLLGVLLMLPCIPFVCLSFLPLPAAILVALLTLIIVNVWQNGPRNHKPPKVSTLNDIRVLASKRDVVAAWRNG